MSVAILENESLGLHQLAIHRSALIFYASGGERDDTPGAADSRVQLANRVCEALWTPLPRHVLGNYPCLKDEPARCFEDTGDDHLALCDVLEGARSCVDFRHVCSPLVVARNPTG